MLIKYTYTAEVEDSIDTESMEFRKQCVMHKGFLDQIAGKGCRSNNGAYLEGYNSPLGDYRMYYISEEAGVVFHNWVHNNKEEFDVIVGRGFQI